MSHLGEVFYLGNIDKHCKVISKPWYYLMPFGKFSKVLGICILSPKQRKFLTSGELSYLVSHKNAD